VIVNMTSRFDDVISYLEMSTQGGLSLQAALNFGACVALTPSF
jgi:hypothetical protein